MNLNLNLKYVSTNLTLKDHSVGSLISSSSSLAKLVHYKSTSMPPKVSSKGANKAGKANAVRSGDKKRKWKRKESYRNVYLDNIRKVSVSVSVAAQDGIVALGTAHTRSASSLSSLPKVALETVPIFAWLNTDRSRPWRVECRPLPFSTPLSFRRSML